jgi:GTP cyclohydrolase III
MAAKVIIRNTVGGTPSEAAVEAANQLVYVTDSRGRKLGLRKPAFLEEFRIIEAAGPELAANTTYMSMLNPLLYLAEIDGAAVDIPRTKLKIEALIQWAGQEGFVAVIEGIGKYFGGDSENLKEKIKNGDGTPA